MGNTRRKRTEGREGSEGKLEVEVDGGWLRVERGQAGREREQALAFATIEAEELTRIESVVHAIGSLIPVMTFRRVAMDWVRDGADGVVRWEKETGGKLGRKIHDVFSSAPHCCHLAHVGQQLRIGGNGLRRFVILGSPAAFGRFDPHLMIDAGIHAHRDPGADVVRDGDGGQQSEYGDAENDRDEPARRLRWGGVVRLHGEAERFVAAGTSADGVND